MARSFRAAFKRHVGSGMAFAMLVWLTIIVFSLLVGIATAFIGLVVIVSVIGYAAWHGYLETINAQAFPRHQVGITSVPRPGSNASD